MRDRPLLVVAYFDEVKAEVRSRPVIPAFMGRGERITEVWGQPGLRHEFQASQNCMARLS